MLPHGSGEIIDDNIFASKGISAGSIGDGRYPVKIKTGLSFRREQIEIAAAELEKKIAVADEIEKAMHQVKYENLQKEKKELSKIEETLNGIVSVRGLIHKNVTIQIKNAEYVIEDEMKEIMFSLDSSGNIKHEAIPKFEL